MSNAGGNGFYIKNNVSHTIRDELCTTQPEFESIWVEFEVPHKRNIVCGLIYIVCGITDRLPIFFIINKLSTLPKNYKLFKRDYSKLDSEALIHEVGNVNWSEVLGGESEATDVNTVFQNFYDRITEIINKHAPIRKLSRKEIKSPFKP